MQSGLWEKRKELLRPAGSPFTAASPAMSRKTRIQPATTSTPWSAGVVFGLMQLLALVVYWPALRGGFIWDDDAHVTRADLRTLSGLFRIWFEPGATQQYYPLLHSAFWFEHKL